MNRRDVLNAFLPATEVDDPTRFAGRRNEVLTLLDALRIEGSVPLIYGHRGLGKSSLAIQMARIAQGDVELLHHLGVPQLELDDDEQFLVFRVTCTHTTADLASLVQLLINAIESTPATAEASRGTIASPGGKSIRLGASLKFLTYERTHSFTETLSRESYENLSLEEKFARLTRLLVNTYEHPLLFVVDEIDRLTDETGLAGFLKAISSPSVKFMIVGIAGSLAELVSDHASIERQVIPVQIGQMSDEELVAIVDGAVAYLKDNEIDARFTPRARERLARLASGFPWFVHVLGQAALTAVFDDQRADVRSADVTKAIDTLISSRFAQRYADQYQNAVRDSRHREIVLRLLAMWRDIDIPTAVVYPMARNLGVSNPSLYKGHLLATTYGSPLYTPAFQDRGILRFRDEMFKVYVRLRASVYANVDTHVREQYEALLD